MPGYKTHITWSTIAGIGLGCVAHIGYSVSLSQSIFGGTLCSLGGVLPDIDSDTSKAYQRCMATIAGTLTLLLASRLGDFSLDSEEIVTSCAVFYLFIIYGVGSVVKKLTRHRGMCHSIPFAVIAAEIIFILVSGSTQLRLFKAFSIFLGVIVHLTLDEINSFEIGKKTKNSSHIHSGGATNFNNSVTNTGVIIPNIEGTHSSSNNKSKDKYQLVRVKKSFGTALKLIDYDNMFCTIIFYLIAMILGNFAMNVQTILDEMGEIDQKDLRGTTAIDHIKETYPSQYDLSVVKWVAENDLVLTPGQEENKKWKELKEMLALGKDNTKSYASNNDNVSTPNSQDPDKTTSLLDVINWDSRNISSIKEENESPTIQHK